MKILKKENWWIWLLLMFFSGGSDTFVLGALLDCYDKEAWYAKGKNWLIGFLCFIIPGIIMVFIFHIEILCQAAAKLKVKGSEIYLSPYIWLLLLIVPVFGWILFIVMFLYLHIYILVSLNKGNGEDYIEK